MPPLSPAYCEGDLIRKQVEGVDGDPAPEYRMRPLSPAYHEREHIGQQVEDVYWNPPQEEHTNM